MKSVCVLLTVCLFVVTVIPGCVPGPTTQQHLESATWLGVVGAGVGALVDDDNRWRGAVIGAGIGSLAGYGLAEVSQRAAREAAERRQTVTYHNPNTNEWVQADPVAYDSATGTATVRTRTWEGERLQSDRYVRVPAY